MEGDGRSGSRPEQRWGGSGRWGVLSECACVCMCACACACVKASMATRARELNKLPLGRERDSPAWSCPRSHPLPQSTRPQLPQRWNVLSPPRVEGPCPTDRPGPGLGAPSAPPRPSPRDLTSISSFLCPRRASWPEQALRRTARYVGAALGSGVCGTQPSTQPRPPRARDLLRATLGPPLCPELKSRGAVRVNDRATRPHLALAGGQARMDGARGVPARGGAAQSCPWGGGVTAWYCPPVRAGQGQL